jgi:hypothetical protein
MRQDALCFCAYFLPKAPSLSFAWFNLKRGKPTRQSPKEFLVGFWETLNYQPTSFLGFGYFTKKL